MTYLASYATDSEFDAEMDDRSFDCAADLADPQGYVLKSLRSLDKVKAMAIQDLKEFVEQTDDDFVPGKWELIRKTKGQQIWKYECTADTVWLIVRKAVVL